VLRFEPVLVIVPVTAATRAPPFPGERRDLLRIRFLVHKQEAVSLEVLEPLTPGNGSIAREAGKVEPDAGAHVVDVLHRWPGARLFSCGGLGRVLDRPTANLDVIDRCARPDAWRILGRAARHGREPIDCAGDRALHEGSSDNASHLDCMEGHARSTPRDRPTTVSELDARRR